ncbi:DUF368 domain-containing protein [Candidatus Borreliella tachyglossi]|uniref:DUF368 domain-containing protein n=1 Tax=Candidatus Borreliella tachyglossi TaxID=1964448 RepID=A0A2S1LYA6_9SPIR|nr:DUF368 domain-containing protein [Candidatus Borreliella tachyglossi]
MSIYIKGLLIGFANILPGVSGGTLALTLGIYYKIIYSSANLIKFKNLKENTTFLAILSLGILTSIILLAKVLKNYILDGAMKEAYLSIFFLGLIIGSIFTLKKEIYIQENTDKNNKAIKYFLFLIGFLTILTILMIRTYNISLDISKYKDKKSIEYYLLIANSGIISGSAMILPGISGSLILLSLGTYKEIINIVSQPHIMLCTIFGISTIIGTGVAILIIKKSIDKHLLKFLYLSTGLILGSTLQMLFIITTLNLKPTPAFFILSIILFITGIWISRMIELIKMPLKEF